MRLIDADALEESYFRYPGEIDREIYEMLHAAPTIDAIPVVHCKDCRYLGIKGLGDGYCKKKMTGNINPYDFCSYGERKEPTYE